jgi:YggT family protein
MFIFRLVDLLFQVYFYLLIGKVILSWLPEFRGGKVDRFISFYTDPYLNFFRGIIPPIGMIDISPIFAFIALSFIEYGVKRLLIALLV